MNLIAGVQMDPIETIDIKGDSTFALMLEAQKRGHQLFYYTPDNLTATARHVRARGFMLEVADRPGAHFRTLAERRMDLRELDVLLLRQDPPFDMHYLTTTWLLDRVKTDVLVVNDPTEVRTAPEKLFVFEFPDLIPPTLICRTLDDARAFRAEYGDIIIKPLYGNGGAGIFYLKADDMNLAPLVELFQASAREPFIVQQYLPAIRDGDKRIILIDGEPVGAINRLPAAGEARSNMHVGGRPEPVELSARDREICARLGPVLRERGLLFAGIDVIGGVLTEINITSPTGLREVERFTGQNLAARLWDVIETRLAGGGA